MARIEKTTDDLSTAVDINRLQDGTYLRDRFPGGKPLESLFLSSEDLDGHFSFCVPLESAMAKVWYGGWFVVLDSAELLLHNQPSLPMKGHFKAVALAESEGYDSGFYHDNLRLTKEPPL